MNVSRLERLLSRIEKAWHEFQDSYTSLSERELLEPGVAGQWSVRDVIAHVTTWEEEALRNLPILVRGERTPRYSVLYGGINSFNARMTEQKKVLSLPEIFRNQDEVHQKLLEYIRSVPEEYLDSKSRFRNRLRLDTYGHYARHAAAIRNKFRVGPCDAR